MSKPNPFVDCVSCGHKHDSRDQTSAAEARGEQKVKEPKCPSCGRPGSAGVCWWCSEERAYDEDY